MAQTRTGYPGDGIDEEWALYAPYLVLLREDARQRVYRLRSGFNAVRYLGKAGLWLAHAPERCAALAGGAAADAAVD